MTGYLGRWHLSLPWVSMKKENGFALQNMNFGSKYGDAFWQKPREALGSHSLCYFCKTAQKTAWVSAWVAALTQREPQEHLQHRCFLYLVRLCISFSAHMRMILRGFSLLKRSLNLKSSLMYLSRFLNSLRVVLNTLMAHSVGIAVPSSLSPSRLKGRRTKPASYQWAYSKTVSDSIPLKYAYFVSNWHPILSFFLKKKKNFKFYFNKALGSGTSDRHCCS